MDVIESDPIVDIGTGSEGPGDGGQGAAGGHDSEVGRGGERPQGGLQAGLANQDNDVEDNSVGVEERGLCEGVGTN